jgi:hypothetical protein
MSDPRVFDASDFIFDPPDLGNARLLWVDCFHEDGTVDSIYFGEDGEPAVSLTDSDEVSTEWMLEWTSTGMMKISPVEGS